MQPALGGVVVLVVTTGAALAQVDEDFDICAIDDGSITPQVQIEHCTRAIESGALSQVDTATTYYNRALSHQDANRPDLALADYGEAIRLDPDYASAYLNRAYLYMDADKLDEAIQHGWIL